MLFGLLININAQLAFDLGSWFPAWKESGKMSAESAMAAVDRASPEPPQSNCQNYEWPHVQPGHDNDWLDRGCRSCILREGGCRRKPNSSSKISVIDFP